MVNKTWSRTWATQISKLALSYKKIESTTNNNFLVGTKTHGTPKYAYIAASGSYGWRVTLFMAEPWTNFSWIGAIADVHFRNQWLRLFFIFIGHNWFSIRTVQKYFRLAQLGLGSLNPFSRGQPFQRYSPYRCHLDHIWIVENPRNSSVLPAACMLFHSYWFIYTSIPLFYASSSPLCCQPCIN